MPSSLAFLRPRSVEETVGLLDQYRDEAKVVAGATALTIMLRQRLIAPRALVSLGAVPGLRTIERSQNGGGQKGIRIGALATHRDVELSDLVRRELPVLARTFSLVANVRVRNVATVGGVLAEADYASDPPAVFLALDAEIEAVGPRGARTIPASELFVGFFETALEPDEIVTAVTVPVPAAGTHGVYEKFMTRSSEDRPCLGVIATVRLDGRGAECADLRVAVGAVAETPQRLPEVEALARGQALTEDVIKTIADRYAAAIDTLADMRGSAWYRTEMIRVWVRRAIERARDEAVAARDGQEAAS